MSALPPEDLYEQSFIRNRGIISAEEQQRLRRACVAIPGLGGVGGIYCAILARSGVGRFKIADPDTFEVPNLNRQYGATMDTMGKNKADVMRRVIESINPSAEVSVLEGGLRRENVRDFLAGADVVIDSLDAYNFVELMELYEVARQRGLCVFKSIPFGHGATMLVFSPESPSFREFFGLGVSSDYDHKQLVETPGLLKTLFNKWVDGYSPSKLHESYLAPGTYDPFDETGKFTNRPLPSFCPSVYLCASLVATEVVLMLLGRRPPTVVPKVLELDLYSREMRITEGSPSEGASPVRGAARKA